MVIKALSTAGKTQGEISRQVGCFQGKSPERRKCGGKRDTTKRDDRKLAKLVRSDRFQKCGEIAQQWNADGLLASRSTTYRRIKEMGYANRISRVKHKKRLTWATWRSGTGQLDSGLELSSPMSRSSAFRSEAEDHEFGGSPTKLTSPAARNPALNFHKAP